VGAEEGEIKLVDGREGGLAAGRLGYLQRPLERNETPRLLAGGATEAEDAQRPIGRGAERGSDADRVDLLALLAKQLLRSRVSRSRLVSLPGYSIRSVEHPLQQGANGAIGIAIRSV